MARIIFVTTVLSLGRSSYSPNAHGDSTSSRAVRNSYGIRTLLTTYLTWRISFLLEVCAVIATLALSTRIKIAKQPRPPAKLDYRGRRSLGARLGDRRPRRRRPAPLRALGALNDPRRQG